MPVTLNPPPFPTPDNAAVSAADKTAGAPGVPSDAFSSLLQGAGEPIAGAANAAATSAAPAAPPGTAGIDRLLSQLTSSRGARDPLSMPAMPVIDRDAAPAADATKLAALADALALGKPDADKPEADKPAASDTVGASELAGMTAMIAAMLSGHMRPDPTPPSGPNAGSSAPAERDIHAAGNAGTADKADASANADAALARKDNAQVGVGKAPIDARSLPPPATLAPSALRDAANADSAAKSGSTKTEALDAPAAPPPGSAFPHSISVATPQHVTIATPVTAAGWQGEFADKLAQVVMTGSDRAEFRLHPANMGPVEVKISVIADQASIVITAPHAATRDALEQALPQLRDLLASQGITLGQASVQSESRPSDQGQQTRGPAQVVDDAPAEITVGAVSRKGLVDVFA